MRHKAAGLHLFDKAAQISAAGNAAFGGAHGLVDGREAAGDDAQTGLGARRCFKRLAYAGCGFQAIGHKQDDGGIRGLGAHQLCVLQRAREEEVVGRTFADGDAHVGLVEILDLSQR